jgi:hypothetical protein
MEDGGAVLAPSPARASTPWVSAPPSSGPVVVPVMPVPHADDAATSFGSASPAQRRVQPVQRWCPSGKGRIPYSRINLGENGI